MCSVLYAVDVRDRLLHTFRRHGFPWPIDNSRIRRNPLLPGIGVVAVVFRSETRTPILRARCVIHLCQCQVVLSPWLATVSVRAMAVVCRHYCQPDGVQTIGHACLHALIDVWLTSIDFKRNPCQRWLPIPCGYSPPPAARERRFPHLRRFLGNHTGEGARISWVMVDLRHPQSARPGLCLCLRRVHLCL